MDESLGVVEKYLKQGFDKFSKNSEIFLCSTMASKTDFNRKIFPDSVLPPTS